MGPDRIVNEQDEYHPFIDRRGRQFESVKHTQGYYDRMSIDVFKQFLYGFLLLPSDDLKDAKISLASDMHELLRRFLVRRREHAARPTAIDVESRPCTMR